MKKRSKVGTMCVVAMSIGAVGLGTVHCDKKKNNKDKGGYMSGPGDQSIKPTADVQGAFGLLIMDNDNQGASLNLMRQHNKTVDEMGVDAPKFDGVDDVDAKDGLSLAGLPYTLGGEAFSFPGIQNGLSLTDASQDPGLKKIDKTSGEIKDALTVPPRDPKMMGGGSQKLPKIRTIAVSPTKDVYLHFENPFVFKTPEDPSVNVWDQSSGYQCQVFKVKGGTLDDLLVNAPEAENLECIDSTHFINSWGTSANSVFQFDQSGNVYYPGAIPNSPKTVVYQRLRDGSATKEMINANICVQNYLITKLGGVFYTGNTCDDGKNSGGNGGGYFRYISPGDGGKVMEIARDWWNFIFDTSVAANTDGKSSDKAVYFGPHAESGTTASWDSACLFTFDPQVEKSEPVISCGGGNDFNDWQQLRREVDMTNFGCEANYFGVNDNCPDCGRNNNGVQTSCDQKLPAVFGQWKKAEWIQEYQTRCESKDKVFAGGGSQISAINQNDTGTVYVVGNIRKKVEGKMSCSVEVRGPHCKFDENPAIKDADGVVYTKSTCTTANGTWVDSGSCNGNTMSSNDCLVQHVWHVADTVGKCYLSTDTLFATPITAFDTTENCVNNQSWSDFQPESKNYSASGDICSADDVAGVASKALAAGSTTAQKVAAEKAARTTFRDWNNNRVKYSDVSGVAAGANGTKVATKFLINSYNCKQSGVSASSGGNNSGGWTEEYKAMAKVDDSTKNLQMLSLPSEQAIKLWIVDNVAYYSSFDAKMGQYLLNTLETTAGVCINLDKTSATECTGDGISWDEDRRACLLTGYPKTAQTDKGKSDCEGAGMVFRTTMSKTILPKFEAYNVASSGETGKIYADGLNFLTNSYEFGTVDVATGTMNMKEGLTGTIKTIVILPK